MRSHGPQLCVEEVQGVRALADHAEEWRALAARAKVGDLFATWEWIESWLAAFLGKQRLATILVREGDRLVGALPLVRQPRAVLWRANSLQAPVNAHSPRPSFLFEDDAKPVVEATMQHLERCRSPLRLHVRSLPVDCPGAVALQSPPGGGLLSRLQPGHRSGLVRLDGGWRPYLESRPSRVRREWRRKRRRLDRAGRVQLVTLTRASDVSGALAEVLEIEKQSWKHSEGTSLASEPGCERFYGQLATRCAERGWLRLHLLRLDNRPVAHVFAVAFRDEHFALKTSYDRRRYDLSPGLTVMLHALESALEEGCVTFDLLGSESRWKAELATEIRAHVDLCLFSPALVDCRACALIQSRVRPFAHRRLPWLVQARRRLLGLAGSRKELRRQHPSDNDPSSGRGR